MSQPSVWYFAFYGTERDPRSWFGHVDMWGFDPDTDSWVFLSPSYSSMPVEVTHIAEEVDALFAARLSLARHVLRYDRAAVKNALPPVTVQTCASICGHVVGLRAFTPWGLRRKLLANGAEVLNIETSEGRSSGKS
jgi:hypothetical protein